MFKKYLFVKIQSQGEHDEEEERWTEAGTWGLDRRAERQRGRERERPEATFATALPMAQKGAPRQIL